VAQEDVFSVTSTPYEALMFIANLKLGPRVAQSYVPSSHTHTLNVHKWRLDGCT
jgi:hypothetical protein